MPFYVLVSAISAYEYYFDSKVLQLY